MSDLSKEEFLDGWALWQEHRPQSPADWVRVAERCIDNGTDTSNGSVMFQALVLAVERCRESHSHSRGADESTP